MGSFKWSAHSGDQAPTGSLQGFPAARFSDRSRRSQLRSQSGTVHWTTTSDQEPTLFAQARLTYAGRRTFAAGPEDLRLAQYPRLRAPRIPQGRGGSSVVWGGRAGSRRRSWSPSGSTGRSRLWVFTSSARLGPTERRINPGSFLDHRTNYSHGRVITGVCLAPMPSPNRRPTPAADSTHGPV